MIVAIDSSGKTAGVCIVQGGQVLAEELLDNGLTHSQTLLPLVEGVLARLSLAPAQVSCYAVTVGPGSFTGLRIGLSLVKGLALPRATPAVGVSTLAAIAHSVEFEGTVVPALDARRGEVYWAAFRRAGGVCERLLPDAAGPASTIAAAVNLQNGPVVFVGDGAELCYTIYDYVQRPVQVQPFTKPHIALGAAKMAQEAVQAGLTTSVAGLAPVYLRLSQAERERAARLACAGQDAALTSL